VTGLCSAILGSAWLEERRVEKDRVCRGLQHLRATCLGSRKSRWYDGWVLPTPLQVGPLMGRPQCWKTHQTRPAAWTGSRTALTGQVKPLSREQKLSVLTKIPHPGRRKLSKKTSTRGRQGYCRRNSSPLRYIAYKAPGNCTLTSQHYRQSKLLGGVGAGGDVVCGGSRQRVGYTRIL